MLPQLSPLSLASTFPGAHHPWHQLSQASTASTVPGIISIPGVQLLHCRSLNKKGYTCAHHHLWLAVLISLLLAKCLCRSFTSCLIWIIGWVGCPIRSLPAQSGPCPPALGVAVYSWPSGLLPQPSIHYVGMHVCHCLVGGVPYFHHQSCLFLSVPKSDRF